MQHKSLVSDLFSPLLGGEGKRSLVLKVASESNGENRKSHIFPALPDLSELTGKRMKHCDKTSGESNKRFVLTQNYLLTTNRAVTARGRGCRLYLLYSQQHLPQVQAFSFPLLQTGFSSRTQGSPGTDPARGTGSFQGGDHRCLYTKWQFSSSIIPCYCITRSYRGASISFQRF